MAGTYTRQHVVKVARKAILGDDVLVIADTNVWFDYFDPAPGVTHETDYERERSYLDAMIKSRRLRLPKLVRDELTRVYNGRYRRQMGGAALPARAEFNLLLRDKLDAVPVVRQDRRHSLPKVEEMYGRIWGQRGRHRRELHGWGSSKSRDASVRPNWHRLDSAARAAFIASAGGPSKTDKGILAIAAHLKAVNRGTFVILFTRDADFLAFSHIIYEKFAVLAVSPDDVFPST